VEAFHEAKENDSGVTQRNSEFIDMCEAGGWRFLASYGQVHVFFTIDENATPIQSDPNTKLKMINKSLFKQNGLIVLYMLILFNLFRTNTYDPFSFLTDATWFIFAISWGVLTSMLVVLLLSQLFWYIKSKRAIAHTEELPRPGRGSYTYALAAMAATIILVVAVSAITGIHSMLVLMLWCLGATAALVLINTKVQKLIKTKMMRILFTLIFFSAFFIAMLFVAQPTSFDSGEHVRAETRGLPFPDGVHEVIVYHDPLPLTLEDIEIKTSPGYSTYKIDQGSFLISKASYSQYPFADEELKLPRLDYVVYTTDSLWLNKLIKDYYLGSKYYFRTHGFVLVPGAYEAYSSLESVVGDGRGYNDYLLLLEDRVIYFGTNANLDPASLTKAVEKLK
jgi:hypothetical protein